MPTKFPAIKTLSFEMQACFAKRIMHSHFRPCHHHCWHRSEPEWPSLHQISLFCRSPVWRMCPSLSALTGREARVRNTLALYVSVPLLCTQRCGHQLTRQLTFILPGKPLAGCVLLFSCQASLWQGVCSSSPARMRRRLRGAANSVFSIPPLYWRL